MPGLNGTGPMGQGPRTGRGMGNCQPANNVDADVNVNETVQANTAAPPTFWGLGRGMGRGRGMGCGMGRGRGMGRGMGRGRGWW